MTPCMWVDRFTDVLKLLLQDATPIGKAHIRHGAPLDAPSQLDNKKQMRLSHETT